MEFSSRDLQNAYSKSELHKTILKVIAFLLRSHYPELIKSKVQLR